MLQYSRRVSDRRPTNFVWLFGLLWLLALPVLALPAGGSRVENGLSDDYCGRPQLNCPRTSASNCVCYLGTRTQAAETTPACPRPMVMLRLPKPRPEILRYLPQPEPLPLEDRFWPPVPTRPPCALA